MGTVMTIKLMLSEASVVFTYIMYIDVYVAFGMRAKCIKMEGFLVGLVYEVV